MARKQLGMVDDALLARVDARAVELGQTRRVFTERALESALGKAGTTGPEQQPRAESAVEEPRSRRQNRPAPTRTPPRYGQSFIPHAIPPCPTCGKANGVHKGDCPQHPRAGR